MARSYAAQVAEGKRLVAAEGDAKWGLGDLALEVAPMTEPGPNNNSQAALTKFADEIGVEFSTLREYRRIAHEFPPATRVAGASWSVHRELANIQDAHKWIKDLVKQGKATVDEARKITGVKPTRYPTPTTTTAKAAAAKELLADPLVRRAVVSDINVRADLFRTTREHDAQTTSRVKRRQREDHPGLVASGEFLDALSHLTKARRECLRAVELIRGVAPLSANGRKTLTRDLGYLGEVIAILNQYAETGQAGTLADEIEAFLAAEVSE
jgi:hypothetical protein